jgi:hypothetical protein
MLEIGLRIKPVVLTNQTKADLIQGLSVALEQREIGLPNIPCLLNELQIFSYEILPSGRIRYSAPDGHHDDTVISLALANSLLQGPSWKDATPQTWDPFPPGLFGGPGRTPLRGRDLVAGRWTDEDL